MNKIKFKALIPIFFLMFCYFIFPLNISAEESKVKIRNTNDAILLNEVLYNIKKYHISNPDISVLIDSAIDGMLNFLNDPNTEYISPEKFNEYIYSLDNKYIGIGIEIKQEDAYPIITNVFASSPAQSVGLKAGDFIIKVNNENVFDIPLETVSKKIRGKENTTVSLTIRRDNEEMNVLVIRKHLTIPTVDAELIDDNIIYIKINSFNENTPSEFIESYRAVSKCDPKGIILDLRNNPGGYLTSAVEIADYFLPKGVKIIDVAKNSDDKITFYSENDPIISDLKLAVLIDENTASAAEILAGILKYYNLSSLVGEKTYGKGTVQTIINLSNGGGLKLTIAEYKLAGYVQIEGIGLTPDKRVIYPELQVFSAKNILNPSNKYEIFLNINQRILTINDFDLKAPLITQEDGKSYIPVRFIAEILGCDVEYCKKTSAVIVTKEKEREIIYLNNQDSNYDFIFQSNTTYINVNEIERIAKALNVKIDFKK